MFTRDLSELLYNSECMCTEKIDEQHKRNGQCDRNGIDAVTSGMFVRCSFLLVLALGVTYYSSSNNESQQASRDHPIWNVC